jgi:hypothetical protein
MMNAARSGPGCAALGRAVVEKLMPKVLIVENLPSLAIDHSSSC